MRGDQHLARTYRSFHYPTPRRERFVSQILAIVKKAIEDGIHRVSGVLLKELKPGNPFVVEYNSFAIENQGLRVKACDRCRNSWKSARANLSVPG
jgi:hypothetical protein